jgi:hypothetical protein
MNSIILSYPGFHALPKAVKQMLVASEHEFFSEAKAAPAMLGQGKMAHCQAPRTRVVNPQGERFGAFNGAWLN